MICLCRIWEVLVYMRANNPKTQIILLAILPRGGQTDQTWWDWPNRFSHAIDIINDKLQEYSRSLDGVNYVDCSEPFLPGGKVSHPISFHRNQSAFSEHILSLQFSTCCSFMKIINLSLRGTAKAQSTEEGQPSLFRGTAEGPSIHRG